MTKEDIAAMVEAGNTTGLFNNFQRLLNESENKYTSTEAELTDLKTKYQNALVTNIGLKSGLDEATINGLSNLIDVSKITEDTDLSMFKGMSKPEATPATPEVNATDDIAATIKAELMKELASQGVIKLDDTGAVVQTEVPAALNTSIELEGSQTDPEEDVMLQEQEAESKSRMERIANMIKSK